MKTLSLNGAWTLNVSGGEFGPVPATVPGSVYTDLLNAGKIPDPFYRDNENEALKLMEHDFTYTRAFEVPEDLLACDRVLLRCEGLDTLADIETHGAPAGHADNMHRTWEFDVKALLKPGENAVAVTLRSPTRFVREAYEADPCEGSSDAMRGFPHLRKAACMFGWDWGPRLPDAGIWRDISLIGAQRARLGGVYVRQRHEAGRVFCDVEAHISRWGGGELRVDTVITAPDGRTFSGAGKRCEIEIENPRLWWPNGYGDQPLYGIRVVLSLDGVELDRWEKRIGLRSLTVKREKDQWGESFCHQVNGVSIFAMGADYIPEDNLLARVTPERTRRLLEDAAAAHMNLIRVWGGGYYPDDWFYDACDELGLLVWQDFMFACAAYRLTEAFEENLRAEFVDNIRRLRHHASLALWCGNNEMEGFIGAGHWVTDKRQQADYIKLFEYIIPKVLKVEDPETFYWPSSPSSGGSFDAPQDPDRGDVHYWDVWHGMKPFTDYRNHLFRYVSEFGFQSFPCMETIRSFTLPQDRNVFSYVMEMHQRNSGANGKILQYLSQNYLYPSSLELLVYASQLLQADAIRYGVEHLRRGRNEDRCMGAVYWQLNDCWPVASWSSVDYYHRPKALQYAAKRFFAPVLLSCEEVSMASMGRACISEPDLQAPESNLNPTIKAPGNPYAVSMDHAIEAPERSHAGTKEFSAVLNVSNETWETVTDEVVWQVRDPYGGIVSEGSMPVCADPFSSYSCEKLDLSWIAPYEHHLYYYLSRGGQDGSVLFVPPKHYHFADPKLEIVVDETAGTITVTAAAYAKGVEICGDGDLVPEDNFFDMEPGSRTLKVLRRNSEEGPSTDFGKQIRVRSVFDIR